MVSNFSNIKAVVNSINVHDNEYYAFVPPAYMSAEEEKKDYFILQSNGKFFPSTKSGGGLSISICDIEIIDSTFDGCESVKGDAIGIIRSKAVIDGCTVKNSKGKNSGIYISCAETKPIYILNTVIADGEGEGLHIFPSIDGGGNIADAKGGTVELAFCELYGNEGGNIENTAISEDKISTLLYRGCKMVDGTLRQNGEAPDYNIISAEKSNKTVSVPYDVYKTWANGRYKELSGDLRVGVNKTEDSLSAGSNWWIWFIVVGVVIVVAIAVFVIIVRQRQLNSGLCKNADAAVEDMATRQDADAAVEGKTMQENFVDEEARNETEDKAVNLLSDEEKVKCFIKECEICKNLSEGEKEVLFLLLTTTLTREKIAEELIVSVDTVKKRIGVIYKKFDVVSRYELLIKINKANKELFK